jgi:hypothetical protein
VNNGTRLLCCLMLALLCFVSCRGLRTHKSDNWEVTIQRAGYEKDYQYLSFSGTHPETRSVEGLVVKMTIRYVGRGDSDYAPQVLLKRGEQVVEPSVTHTEDFFSDESERDEFGRSRARIGKDPKTGRVSAAKADYVYFVPNDGTEYVLTIGDLKPIKVRS